MNKSMYVMEAFFAGILCLTGIMAMILVFMPKFDCYGKIISLIIGTYFIMLSFILMRSAFKEVEDK